MRSINPDTLTALSQRVIRIAFLCRVEFPDPYRIAFTSLARNYAFDGEVFLGVGALGGVTQSSETGDLNPSDYQITISGINDDVLATASQLSYMNHAATVWALVLDDDDQVIGDPFIWFKGRTDQIQVEYGSVSSVVIEVRDRMTDWSRPRVQRYTDESHQNQYPGDKFFEFVTEVAGRDVEWPADTWFEKNT